MLYYLSPTRNRPRAKAKAGKDRKMNTKETLKGDANGDGKVNVTDIVEMVNHILGSESDKFLFDAADVNEDGKVNVTDIVMVVNIILGSSSRELSDIDDVSNILN